MPDVKISHLPPVTTVTGTEVIPIVQGGVTKQATAAQIAALATGPDGAPDAAVAALVTTPATATAAALAATYLPLWKPSTAYVAGQRVVNPSGQTVTANVDFTSGSSYNAANWTDSDAATYISVTQAPLSATKGWAGHAGPALNDGSGATLGSRYGSLAAAQADYPAATSLAQSIDWAAIQSLLQATGSSATEIELLPGAGYVLTDSLLTNYAAAGTKIRAAAGFGEYFAPFPVRLTRPPGSTNPLFGGPGLSKVTLDGFTLDGAGNAGMLIDSADSFEIHLRRLRLLNAPGGPGAVLRSLSNSVLEDIHVNNCGAATITLTDAAITAGTTTLTSASAAFVATDVWKTVAVAGAGASGATLYSRITAVTDAHTVTLSGNAAATVSGATMTYQVGALVLTGNSAKNYASNSTTLRGLHLEFNPGPDLDMGYGATLDSQCEFTMIQGLHIETPTGKPDAMLRLGNVRGVLASGVFIYGGGGPLIQVNRQTTSGPLINTHGMSFVSSYLLGHLTSNAVDASTPARLVDLIAGDGFYFQGDMDSALTEHVRIQSTFGKRVRIVANNWTRSGATSTYMNDQRAATTVAPVAGHAGTGATATLVGNDRAGVITLTTGTGPSAGAVVQVTFGGTAQFDVVPVVTAVNGPYAGSAYAALNALFVTNVSATGFQIGSTGIPSASATFQITYRVEAAGPVS